jgi:hypothetical protein
MNLTERLRSKRSTREREQAPEPAGTGSALHIQADGDVVIDLRAAPVSDDPSVPATTDMTCPNCGAVLHVRHIDNVARAAAMTCRSCGFTFSHRITLPS